MRSKKAHRVLGSKMSFSSSRKIENKKIEKENDLKFKRIGMSAINVGEIR